MGYYIYGVKDKAPIAVAHDGKPVYASEYLYKPWGQFGGWQNAEAENRKLAQKYATPIRKAWGYTRRKLYVVIGKPSHGAEVYAVHGPIFVDDFMTDEMVVGTLKAFDGGWRVMPKGTPVEEVA